MIPAKRTTEQRALGLLALFVAELQKNNALDAIDETLFHAVKDFLENNGVHVHDDAGDEQDTDECEDGFDGEWDHIDGYSSKYIINNSSPDIEWTASDFE